jgi:hypothetical protein
MLYRHEVEEFDRNVDEVVIEEGGIDENDWFNLRYFKQSPGTTKSK